MSSKSEKIANSGEAILSPAAQEESSIEAGLYVGSDSSVSYEPEIRILDGEELSGSEPLFDRTILSKPNDRGIDLSPKVEEIEGPNVWMDDEAYDLTIEEGKEDAQGEGNLAENDGQPDARNETQLSNGEFPEYPERRAHRVSEENGNIVVEFQPWVQTSADKSWNKIPAPAPAISTMRYTADSQRLFSLSNIFRNVGDALKMAIAMRYDPPEVKKLQAQALDHIRIASNTGTVFVRHKDLRNMNNRVNVIAEEDMRGDKLRILVDVPSNVLREDFFDALDILQPASNSLIVRRNAQRGLLDGELKEKPYRQPQSSFGWLLGRKPESIPTHVIEFPLRPEFATRLARTPKTSARGME